MFVLGDCADLPFEDDSFDLVFCSPPYEAQRDYGIGFAKTGNDWVQWAANCFQECLRVCRGLVAFVVEGKTKQFEYSYTPFLLGAELQKRGVKLRKPCVFHRRGIPGTGGPDWLRNDWEPIICGTKTGRLPWSDNTAMGRKPIAGKKRYAVNRGKDGERRNQGEKRRAYKDPERTNPGNVISGEVGGGIGWNDATKGNEAPFPEWLAEFFVLSFCPKGGRVLDPFSGSGTTVHVALKNCREAVGVDIRKCQVELGNTRINGQTLSERALGQERLF